MKCKICEKVGHFPEVCNKGKEGPKKAKVSVLTAEEKGGEAAAAPPPAEATAQSGAPAAALNSIEQVSRHTSLIRSGTRITKWRIVDGGHLKHYALNQFRLNECGRGWRQ